MPTSRPLACVIGSVDHVRPLALAGVTSAVMAPPGAIVHYSRYTARSLPWADPRTDSVRFVRILLDFAACQDQPPLLLPGGDWDLLAVSRARRRLVGHYLLALADADLVENLVDKWRFQRLAERLSLPVPRTRPISGDAGDPAAELDLRFPIVLKPLTRLEERWWTVAGDAKALPLASPAALRRAWPRVLESGIAVVAQELIPGLETRMESYHVYVDAEGAIVADFTGRKSRTYPLAYGHTTALEITDEADVRRLGRELTARLGLTGLAKFDFKRDRRGRLHLLEVNPRATLWNHPAALAGVNLPALLYADLAGLPRPSVRPIRVGTRWCDPLPDARAAVGEGVPLRRWLPAVLRSDAKASFALTDPLPVVLGALWRIRHRADGSVATLVEPRPPRPRRLRAAVERRIPAARR